MKRTQVVVRRDVPARDSSRTVRYAECQKNHAVDVGGFAVDGCREFMASGGQEGTTAALTCAACGCHRSFHRREVQTTEVVSESSSHSSNGN